MNGMSYLSYPRALHHAMRRVISYSEIGLRIDGDTNIKNRVNHRSSALFLCKSELSND